MTGAVSLFRRRVLGWYSGHQRRLPWRVPAGGRGRPDSYAVLVSEAMLQQTQVATVIDYFQRFVRRWPDFPALASAQEGEVLRAWQGLGYYARARNLLKLAQEVMRRGGALPERVEELRQLPGVGRYTAGAVASIAFGQRAPILDGNVARVLCRLDGVEGSPQQAEVRRFLWRRAEEILPRQRVGDFNAALMDLGATVCTPRNPRCLVCPVQDHCEAFARGIQERIPPPKPGKPRPVERRWVFCIERAGRYLVEQRPARGRWGGMWQFVTLERQAELEPAEALRRLAGIRVSRVRSLGTLRHQLTHRRYELEVLHGFGDDPPAASDGARRWVTLEELDDYALPRPQWEAAQLLKGG